MQLRYKNWSFLLLLTACVAPIGCYTSQNPSSNTATMGLDADEPGIQDRIFVQDALASGRQEIAMSLLGVQRAENLDLQLLAQRLVDDRTQANKDLETIAKLEEILLSEQSVHEVNISYPTGTSGVQFDQMYLQHMLRRHEADIKKFEAAARTARSPGIRTFAARTLPVLREHFRIAQNIGKAAGLGEVIEEAAGAEALSPYYQGDGQHRHQFDPKK